MKTEKYTPILNIIPIIIIALIIHTHASPKLHAQQHKILAVVNDVPITEHDVQQQLKIMKVMGDNINEQKNARKKALDDLISQELKKWEAQRLDIQVNEDRINEMVNSSENLQRLLNGLQEQGISPKNAEDFVTTNILWNEIVKRRFGTRQISPKKVQQIYDKLKNDPAMKPTRLYTLKRILLPIQQQISPEMTRQVLYDKLVEARAIIQRGGKCDQLENSTKGISNIVMEPNVEVPVHELDPQLKAVLEEEKPGKILGPILVENDTIIMLLAYCGNRTFEPPPVTKEMVEARLLNQKYEILSEKYLNELKQVGLIEYR